MDKAKVNGVELEYEVAGSGEPVLLISPVLARVRAAAHTAGPDRPLPADPLPQAGVGRQHAHRPPVSIADHAADAAALLDHLAVRHAHVAGHSSGAAIAAQLALDRPDTVHTLLLLARCCRCRR